MTKFFKRPHLLATLMIALAGTLFVCSCKDDVDESDMYTFTGKTVTSFLNENTV